MANEDTNVVALRKPGGELYIIFWRDTRAAEVMRQLSRWATNPELSFTWHDAAVVSLKVRRMTPPRSQEDLLE